jgi:ppGpp synthetase/RelA/SpoT-type nucleotidyltranferase
MMTDQENERLELQTFNALRGADDVERRLWIEMSTDVPSIEDMAYAIKIRTKRDYKIIKKVLRKRIEKSDPAYDVLRLRDIVGLRIVTLYRLDALRVIPALLKKILTKSPQDNSLFIHDRFEEVVIYSTNAEGDAQGLVNRIRSIFEAHGLKHKVRVEQARSNYTSIHMVVWCRGKYDAEHREVPVEIQVRTALEDVWGEIDHSLKYKRELSTADGVVAQQKRIDGIFAHLNVMKTLIDGVAQYADQIKIQLDEIDTDVIQSIPSRSAQNPLDILDGLPDLPPAIRALVAKAVEREPIILDTTQDDALTLATLQQAREILEEAKAALAEQKISPLTQREANYAIDMEHALTLFEIGKRVESGANILAESEKLYCANEEKFPTRALVKYRHAGVLDALGDRTSAMAKFREVACTRFG